MLVLWDFIIHTNRALQVNRPDIIIKDLKNHKEHSELLKRNTNTDIKKILKKTLNI